MSLLDKLAEKEKAKQFDSVFCKLQPGDIVHGEVTDMGSTITQYGESEYIEIKGEDGQKTTVFLNTVLKKQVEEETVKVGNIVAIKFLGEVQSKKNVRKSYKDFVLVKEVKKG